MRHKQSVGQYRITHRRMTESITLPNITRWLGQAILLSSTNRDRATIFQIAHCRRLAISIMTVLTVLIMLVASVTFVVNGALAAGDGLKILTMAVDESVDSGNPYLMINDISFVYSTLINSELTSVDKNGETAPELALSWWTMNGSYAYATGSSFAGLTHSDPMDWPKASIWEYNLTEDVFWNDGEPFTADDVVWCYNIQLGPNFATYWGYQPYTRWIDHVEKINDHKIRIFFTERTSLDPFPLAFGDHIWIPVMPKHVFSELGDLYIATEWTGVPAVGCGAFMGTPSLLSELISKESITLVKNPYFNFIDGDGNKKGLGHALNYSTQIDKLILKMFSDPSSCALSVRSGDADCGYLPALTYLAWKEDSTLPKNINLTSILGATDFSKQTVFNDFAGGPGSLNALRLDPAVQRAAHIATNKTYIRDVIYKGLAEIGVGLIAPSNKKWYWEPTDEPSTFNITDGDGNVTWNYTKPLKNVMDYDVDLANEILDQAGYTWSGTVGASPRKAGSLVAERMQQMFGTDPSQVLDKELEFEMLVAYSEASDRDISAFHVKDWEKVGIWIDSGKGDHVATLVDDATWNTLVYSYSCNIELTYWSGDIDPNYLHYVPTTESLYGWNEFGTSDPFYDDLYLKQASALTYEERRHWSDQCQKWQYLSGGIITTVYPETCFATNSVTWKNWGDWEKYPVMAINGFFSLNELYSDLRYDPDPKGDNSVGIIIASVSAVAVAIAAILFVRKKQRLTRDEEEGEEEEMTSAQIKKI